MDNWPSVSSTFHINALVDESISTWGSGPLLSRGNSIFKLDFSHINAYV